MRTEHMQRVDLNLLPALVALLEERQVSRAAERVGLSQPAMSRALGRLRDVLGDELLVRSGGAYRLTPRAERIQAQLTDVVPGLEGLWAGERFAPERAEVVFRLVGSDYAVTTFGRRLFQQVLQQSPRSTLCFHGWHERVFDELRRGALDLVFFGGDAPEDIRTEELYCERFVCVVDDEHPLARVDEVTLDAYLKCRHLVIDVERTGQPAVEVPLKALGHERRASLVMPYHAGALTALQGTELVATLPERLVTANVGDARLIVLPTPREIPAMRYRMCWHPLTDADAAQLWFRGMVRSALDADARLAVAATTPSSSVAEPAIQVR